jgi:hypothetical protein
MLKAANNNLKPTAYHGAFFRLYWLAWLCGFNKVQRFTVADGLGWPLGAKGKIIERRRYKIFLKIPKRVSGRN